MPFKVDVKVDDNKFKTFVVRLEEKMLAAQKEAMQESRKELSSYIKDTLLNGVMYKDTTGLPRSNNTTSLPQGLLRKSVFATENTVDGGEQIFVGVRNLGGNRVADLVKLLRFGSTEHPMGWDIAAVRVKSLHFFEHLIKKISGQYFGSDEFFSQKVHHPAMQGKDFINQAFLDKRQFIIDLVRSKMTAVARNLA